MQKKKFLKEIKSATPVNTEMIRKWKTYCWYEASFSGLDRSNQPPYCLKPKHHPEQGSNSLQFCEGWWRWGSCRRKVWSQQSWFVSFKERSCLCYIKVQDEATSADAESTANYTEDLVKIINKVGYTKHQTFMMKNPYMGRRRHLELSQLERSLQLASKLQRTGKLAKEVRSYSWWLDVEVNAHQPLWKSSGP